MRYDGADHRRHHALEARARRVRLRRPAAADHPRRPGRDGRRVRPPPDPHAGPRTRAAAPARHERGAVGQPRPAPGRGPDGRPPRPRWASTNASSATGIGQPGGSNRSATSRRTASRTSSRTSTSRSTPRPSACSSARSRSIIDVDDPVADQAEVALMVRDGNRVLAMLPLVAKGRVDRSRRARLQHDGHVHHERLEPRPDDGQRGGDGARERPAVRGCPRPRRPRSADRLLQPPVPPRAARRGGRPRPSADAGR